MSQAPTQPRNLLALDVGRVRIGVARANFIARLAEPLATLLVDGTELEGLQMLIEGHKVDMLLVGLPRGLEGQDTEQTEYTREFIERLRVLKLPIETIDEAGTSVEAERYLREKHRPHWPHESVDAFAAMILLQDYLS